METAVKPGERMHIVGSADVRADQAPASGHRIYMVLVLLAAWVLRARDFSFATAYMDESVYIQYGRMFLARHFQSPMDQPLRWTWGWYLWPVMAATADRFGGLYGVRVLAAILGLVTVTAIFGFARRLFSPAVGLASALVFALLAPAVFSARIASRDCASVPFLVLGLWAFAAAWKEDRWRWWPTAALALFAAFLCKYVVAVFFPVLVLFSLRKGLKPVVGFVLPLGVACALYAFHYQQDLSALLEYGRQYHQLTITDPKLLWQNYVSSRIDSWILAVLAIVAIPIVARKHGWDIALLCVGAAAFIGFEFRSRADMDWWKHVVYPLIFLTPLAIAGVMAAVERFARFPFARTLAALVLAVSIGWAGSSWHMERFVFWPDVNPVLAYFEGRLTNANTVLTDDSVFGYYFQPPISELSQITNPFFFKYQDHVGDNAYAAAIGDGYFDYLIFDGGVGEDAAHLRAIVQPRLAEHYALRLRATDGVLGHPIEVYARRAPPPAEPAAAAGSEIEIFGPKSGDFVQTTGDGSTELRGRVVGAQKGWYVTVEVYTNRWYSQGDKIELHPTTGIFFQTIYLAGQGQQQCQHMVRVQVFDSKGHRLGGKTEFGITRLERNGSRPTCP